MAQKPDKQHAKQIINQITQADTRLSEIYATTEMHKNTIRQIYGRLQAEASGDLLEALPVEELNRDKSGIRVSVLKNAGINNIKQLVGMTPQRLMSMNGIGQDSAVKIARKVQEIQAGLAGTAKVKIEATDKTRDNQNLIQQLAILLHGKQTIDKAYQLYQSHHASIVQNVVSAKKINSFFGWLFVGEKKKNAAIESLTYLENMVNQGLPTQAQKLSQNFQMNVRSYSTHNSWKEFEENSAPFFALLEQVVGGDVVMDTTLHGLPKQLAQSVELFPLDTSMMKAVLRNYQTFGTKYALHQKRTLLGDEMGLGKTMQAIAAMAHLAAAEGKTHCVVVCPVSVMINWTREIAKHSDLTSVKVHGDDRQEAFDKWKAEGGVAVTTFETISRLEFGDELSVDMLVVDEAHYVKNPDTIRTKALVKFAEKSEYILLMTGTPLENKVEEMIFLISLLNETVAGEIKTMVALTQAPEFREKIAPVYLRRVREDVLTELPEKLEKEEWCEMTKEEEDAYKDTLVNGSHMKVRQVSWNVPDIKNSTKANRLLEICEDAMEDGRKVIVFSFFLDTITKVQSLLGDKCYGPINGGVPAAERQAIVDEFAKGPAGSVLIAQITAGGVGLNIQAASVVVLCEPQWKPSTENQAISRVYRMGQARNVLVHRLLSDNTVDEQILEILRGKTEIFEGFADESAVDEAAKTMTATKSVEAENNKVTGDNETAKNVNESKAMNAIVQKELERYGLTRAIATPEITSQMEEAANPVTTT